jgi:hypothetical protein
MKPTRPKNNGMDNPLVRWLVIYAIPWPKGKARTAPEMLVTQPSVWAADMQRLHELLDTAANVGSTGKWARHPAFGQINGNQYGHLIYRHFNHHLTQFGV